MNAAAWIALVGVLLGTPVTAFVTYKIAKRNTSGNISTSDAASLWKESNDLRREYRERAESLEKRLEIVNDQLRTVLSEMAELKLNSSGMERKITELEAKIADLTKENERLLALKGDKV